LVRERLTCIEVALQLHIEVDRACVDVQLPAGEVEPRVQRSDRGVVDGQVLRREMAQRTR
jgi:hypothetical protein